MNATNSNIGQEITEANLNGFSVPKHHTSLTFFNPDFYGKALTDKFANIKGVDQEHVVFLVEQLLAQGCQKIRTMTDEALYEIREQEDAVYYGENTVKKIDKEDYMFAFDALPPVRWTRGVEREIFMMPEPITDTLNNFYIRMGVGEKAHYFKILASRKKTNDEIVKLVVDSLF